MVQIPSWLHSILKELSNEYSHAHIRVKTKKLWPRQVREEKPVAVQKISRDQEMVSRPENHVVTRKLCRDQKTMSRPGDCVATRAVHGSWRTRTEPKNRTENIQNQIYPLTV